jgi:uncharacterized Tic20 family protein
MNDTAHPAPTGAPATQAMPAPQGAPAAIDPYAERGWGMISHVVALVAMVLSAGTLGFVGSLAIYLVYKDRGPFVRAHAANSLNIQITMLIWIVVSIPLILAFGVGLITLFLAPVVAFVLHVLGAIKANNGEWWSPPLTPQFVR